MNKKEFEKFVNDNPVVLQHWILKFKKIFDINRRRFSNANNISGYPQLNTEVPFDSSQKDNNDVFLCYFLNIKDFINKK